MEIPTEPELKLPQRKKLKGLGTRIEFVDTLNEKYLSDEGEFKRKADIIRQGREAKGKKNLYQTMQPFVRPNLDELLEKRIDVNFVCNVDGKPVTRWCQGEVVGVNPQSEYCGMLPLTSRVLRSPLNQIQISG